MCRITVLSGGSLPVMFKRRLLDRIMIANSADDTQQDGWGVTNGNWVVKSGTSYHDTHGDEYAKLHAEDIDPHDIVVGHVRKASWKGTIKEDKAAHPYEYLLPNGKKLIAAHNGFVTGKDFVYGADILTDTQRFMPLLVKLVEEHDEITTEIIKQWLSHLYDTSAFVFVIQYDGITHIVTDPNQRRNIFFMELEDGTIIFNTSSDVLKNTKEWLKTQGVVTVEDDKGNSVSRLKQGAHLQINGDFTMVCREIDIHMHKEVKAVYARPAITQPVAGTLADGIKKLQDKTNPMRLSLLRLWAADLMGFRSNHLQIPLTTQVFTNASLNDLDTFIDLADCVFNGGDEEQQKKRRRLLTTWNRLVPHNWGKDGEVHVHTFGLEYFWIYPQLINEDLFASYIKELIEIYGKSVDSLQYGNLTYTKSDVMLGQVVIDLAAVVYDVDSYRRLKGEDV